MSSEIPAQELIAVVNLVVTVVTSAIGGDFGGVFLIYK